MLRIARFFCRRFGSIGFDVSYVLDSPPRGVCICIGANDFILGADARSLKSLQAFLRSGELFDDDAVVDLVNVLRGMARCRQADEVWRCVEIS